MLTHWKPTGDICFHLGAAANSQLVYQGCLRQSLLQNTLVATLVSPFRTSVASVLEDTLSEGPRSCLARARHALGSLYGRPRVCNFRPPLTPALTTNATTKPSLRQTSCERGQTLNLCQQLKKLDLLFVPGAVFPYPSNRQAWRPRSSSPVRGDARYGRAPSFLCLRTSFRFCWPARINEIAEYRDGSTARWSSPPTALVLDFLHLYLRDVPW